MINFDDRYRYILDYRYVSSGSREGRVLLGDEVLVDIPCLGDFRGDSFPVYRQRVCVRYLRRIRLLIVLDDQGDFRAGGACAERLVPSKSEKKIPLGR